MSIKRFLTAVVMTGALLQATNLSVLAQQDEFSTGGGGGSDQGSPPDVYSTGGGGYGNGSPRGHGAPRAAASPAQILTAQIQLFQQIENGNVPPRPGDAAISIPVPAVRISHK